MNCRVCSKSFEPRTHNNKYCSRECRKKFQSQNWLRVYHTDEKRNLAVKKANRKNFVLKRATVQEMKNVPCMDCGKRYSYYVMDFDHRVSEDKEFHMSFCADKRRGIKGIDNRHISEIRKEALKCDVVCSNCHRERTHQRRIQTQDEG